MAKLQGKDKELSDKVAALMKEYGYKVTRYYVSSNMADARFTINADRVSETGESPEAARYKTLCGLEGFKPEWLYRKFTVGKKTYRLEGFRAGKSTKFVVVSDDLNRRLVARPSDVIAALERTDGALARGEKVE